MSTLVARVDEPFKFVPTASDPEQDRLTYTIANKPRWASFDSQTGTLSGTPTSADAGNYAGIELAVTDGVSISTTRFTLVVGTDAASGSVTLAWQPPTENMDGSTSQLGGYRIHYGTTPGRYSSVINVASSQMTSFVVSGLSTQTYYFAVTAISADGAESAFSAEVSKAVG